MAHTISMNAPGASIEGFSANIPNIIRDTIGKKLREEGLGALRIARDDALCSSPPHPHTVPYLQQQFHLYKEGCYDLFKRDRPALHKAIDDVVDELEQEVHQELVAFGVLQPLAPISPQPISMELLPASRPTGADEYNYSQPRAPVADMASPDLGMRSPRRSVTPNMLPPATLELPATNIASRASEAVSVTEAGSPVATIAPASSTKRPAPIGAAHIADNPSKRMKTTKMRTKKPIPLAGLQKDEHVFVQKGYEGRYVYRCNLTKCKEKLGKDPVFFTHPRTAQAHFFGKGHSINNKEKMFQKWAYLVIDVTENPSGKEALSPIIQAPLTPKSPAATFTANNKGKQPEDPNRYMFATPRAQQAEVSRQSAAEGNTPHGVIDLDADTDLFVASDNEIQPSGVVNTVKLNARRQERKSYRDIPLGPYEFIE